MQKAKTKLQVLLGIYLLLFMVAVVFQRFVILQPKSLNGNYQYVFSDKTEEGFLSPEKDIELNTLYFHTKQLPKGIVFYIHGNADNLARWGKYAHAFTDRGYDALLYDYRGYGKSTGYSTEANMLADAQFIYDKLKLQFPENKIVVYGRSLGTGIATRIAADNMPKKLILETPYYSLPDLWWSYLPILPYKLISTFQMPTYDWIQRVNCPIHIFHGTADNIVLYNQSQKLVQLLNKPNVLTTIPSGNHKDLDKFTAYQLTLNTLLE